MLRAPHCTVIELTVIATLFAAATWPFAIQAACERTSLPMGDAPVVHVDSVKALEIALRGDTPVTIVLAPGEYRLKRLLRITQPDITIRGNSGNRSEVIIRGGGMRGKVSHVFQVAADNFTLADVTVGWVGRHAVQVHGERGVRNTTISNVRLVNAGEQLLKISHNRKRPSKRSDGGVIEYSSFEFPDGSTLQSYSGGISAIAASNWVVRANSFLNIRSPEEVPTGPAILFWHGSENTLIEGNVIKQSDRGIQLGLKPGGHIGGLVINNFVHAQTDVGIGLEKASGARVYNNTVFVENYPNAIEYRFDKIQQVEITNNLVNKQIVSRDGGTASLKANVELARDDWFVEAATGDLHLSGGLANIVDQGHHLPELVNDIDCDRRPIGDQVDVGADEFTASIDSNLDTSPESGASVAYFRFMTYAEEAKSRVGSVLGRPEYNPWLLAVVVLESILVVVLAIMVLRLRRRNQRLQRDAATPGDESV